MGETLIDKLTATPEGMKLYQQERLILEVTELICELMEGAGVKKSELAERLGRSKGYITQLLDGRANMTLRTISDVLWALDSSLHVSSGPLDVGKDSGAESAEECDMVACSEERFLRVRWGEPAATEALVAVTPESNTSDTVRLAG